MDFSELLPSEEVNAFHHFNDEIQVYSNSWGPEDNGYTVQGPQALAQAALQVGVESVSILVLQYWHKDSY